MLLQPLFMIMPTFLYSVLYVGKHLFPYSSLGPIVHSL